MNPIVSVVMPVYNAENYIEDSIESILKQSFINFELIIINDGSTDHSEYYINRFKDKRIRYFKHPINRGLISSLNEGIQHANGEFIARLDADDIANADRLFRQVQFLLRNPDYAICASSYEVINEKGKKKFQMNLPKTDREVKTLLVFCNCICHSSVMLRKSDLYDQVYRQNYEFCEDYDLWSRLVTRNKVSILPDRLVKYRLHNSNISIKNRIVMRGNVSKIYAYFLDFYGLPYTREEFLIHNALLSYNITFLKRAGYEQLEKWVIKLINMFYYDEYSDLKIAKIVLIRRWLTVCMKGGQYGRLILNPFMKNNKINYINILLGKIKDIIIGRNSVYDF